MKCRICRIVKLNMFVQSLLCIEDYIELNEIVEHLMTLKKDEFFYNKMMSSCCFQFQRGYTAKPGLEKTPYSTFGLTFGKTRLSLQNVGSI